MRSFPRSARLSSHKLLPAAHGLAWLALLVSPAADAATVTARPGTDSISQALAGLSGPGPHTINLDASLVPGENNHFIENDTLVISGQNVTIVGMGNAAVLWSHVVGTEAIRVEAGGSLTLIDIRMDGSVPPADMGQVISTLSLCNFGGLGHAGVRVDSGGTLAIEGGVYRCHIGAAGAAVQAFAGSVDIYDAKFEINLANDGGHISAVRPTRFVVAESTFEYGAAVSGVGGAIFAQGDVEIRDNEFYGNEAVAGGGALYLDDEEAGVSNTAEVWGNTFEDNQAIHVITYEVFEEDDEGDNEVPVFTLLTYQGKGGAVHAGTANVDFWDNLMCGNVADMGGALMLPGDQTVVMENNVFSENLSYHYGGGIFVDGAGLSSDPRIVNNTFIGNGAGVDPADNTVLAFGAGGHMALDGTLAELTNNVFSRARWGAGILGKANTRKNWDLGDPIFMDYNLFHLNCDERNCEESQHLSGDLDTHALTPTNVMELDPLPVYFGSGDLNCFPDAFYPDYGSVVVDNGTPDLQDKYDLPSRPSDIGAFGGPRADVEDLDGDGYADIFDCDDHDPNIHPDAAEICDFRDNNCNGEVDEGLPNSWWLDNDGDGFGGFGRQGGLPDLRQCTAGGTPPAGYADNNEDCDDADDTRYPGAVEICDFIDNDCDELIDLDDDLPVYTYYEDRDGDGFGGTNRVDSCFATAAEVVDAEGNPHPFPLTTQVGDCNDNLASSFPGNPEVCDGGIDNDCNPATLEDEVDGTVWYLDEDGDGYGAETSARMSCSQPEGHVAVAGDCNDLDGGVRPDAEEICDGLDNNCDGEVDNDPTDGNTWYADSDGDGAGDPNNFVVTCGDAPPDGYFAESELDRLDDCDDADPENACAQCGCKASPTPSSTGLLMLLAVALIGRRRR